LHPSQTGRSSSLSKRLCFESAPFPSFKTMSSYSSPQEADSIGFQSFYSQYLQQRVTPKCFENGPQCVTTILYYHECCEDDCCARAQPMVKVIVFVLAIGLVLILTVKAFRTLSQVRKVRRNKSKVASLLPNYEEISEKKPHVVIQCW
ncbi:hypothetical protein PMAYCL1PPCAC_19509, partial [Pristionchus mayeri]